MTTERADVLTPQKRPRQDNNPPESLGSPGWTNFLDGLDLSMPQHEHQPQEQRPLEKQQVQMQPDGPPVETGGDAHVSERNSKSGGSLFDQVKRGRAHI